MDTIQEEKCIPSFEETMTTRRPLKQHLEVRKRRMKILPILLWAGLSYMTIRETAIQIGANAAAATTPKVNGGDHHDLVIADDFHGREIDTHDINDPNYNDENAMGDSDAMPPGIIVVAAVDGTLAGISKETGQVLWKQSENLAGGSSSPLHSASSLMKSTTNNSLKASSKQQQHRGGSADTSQILRPLVSTTTTTKSASDAAYKAVPSVDGTIYTTTNEISMTTSVKDLVVRSPFLDPRGKFYVGSKYASAAALDAETGQVLRVLSSTSAAALRDGGKKNDKDATSSSLPTLDNRHVVWIGRVDHEISVQDAKTGMIDAQFSVAEVMSVADMHGMMRKYNTLKSEPAAAAIQTPSSGSSSLPAMTTDSMGDLDLPSALVATPNGNVGLWNFEDDRFAWVANEAFDSPIAYALDGTTGKIMGVDIIPDVTDPNANMDDLTREMERQSEMVSLTNTPVVGAMPNGQLYALPLRRKRRAAVIGQATNGGATVLASTTSSAAAAAASSGSVSKHITHTTVSQLPGRTSAHFHQNDNSQQQYHQYNSQHQQQQQQQLHSEFSNGPLKSGTLVAKKACVSTSPSFPSCLLESYNDRRVLPETPPAMVGGDGNHQHPQPPPDGSLVVSSPNNHGGNGGFHHPLYGYISPQDLGGFYHPTYGYVSPQDLYGPKKRTNKKRSSDQKLFRLLGSWLPPTIALLFVVSFEMGRRKRLKDETKDPKNFVLTAEQMEKVAAQRLPTANRIEQRGGIGTLQQQGVISVSEDVLGYGGHGTVVYKGVLDGRNVAVKRMLKAYHASADREISLLIESDGDPNVVRYFLKEVRGDFVYLALELCDLSLHDLIGVLSQEPTTGDGEDDDFSGKRSSSMDATRRILFQIASGVKHLHSLRIVHRDLKPANILLAISKEAKKKVKEDDGIFSTFVQNSYDAKISDMGLGKQLIGQSSIGASFIGESSFRGNKSGATSVGVGPGTVGWQAPEVMAMRSTSDTSGRSVDSSNHIGESRESQTKDLSSGVRTSRSVDIFSLGCIFYSVLIPGSHPFGDWYEREANIMHNRPKLDPLKKISSEAYDLIRSMLDRNPRLRPTAKEVCKHPFFWKIEKKISFLCDFSDRLETDLIHQSSSNVFSSLAIERGAANVVGTSWGTELDSALIDNVQKFRSYDYSCVRDLLRLIRNKHHHFEELPEEFRLSTVPNQNAMYLYFATKFPELIMHCYSFCRQNLTEVDQMVSSYDISPSKSDAKEIPSAPISDTVKKANGDEGMISVSQTNPNVLPEEADRDIVDDVHAEVVTDDSDNELDEDIVVWEGSIAAKTFNCRGWHRSQDEWSSHIEPFYKKRDPSLKRRLEDPKFRTRLCNHWDQSLGTFCPMRKKNKCVFAHGPVELRVKEGKKNRWGKLVDRNGNNSNRWHSGGEDTYGAAMSIEKVRKDEGKWNASKDKKKNNQQGPASKKKKSGTNQTKQKATPKQTA